MAIMNRNVNLEEINTDAFMGISYLNHQTIPQKLIFVSGVVAAVGVSLLCSFLWDMNAMASLGLALIPLLIAVAFGCNFNEDLSLIRYFSLIVSKPCKKLYSKPMEDLEQIREREERLKQEEQEREAKAAQISDEAQGKLLRTMLIAGLLFIVVIIVAIVIINSLKVEEIHHTVSVTGSIVTGYLG